MYHLCISVVVVGLLALPVSAQQTLHLTLHSPPGEFIGGGQDWDITYTSGNTTFFNANLSILGAGSFPNSLRFSMLQPTVPDNYLTAAFGTNMLGQPLQQGTYLDAQRASFASAGHPGLDIGFQHRGSNTLTGSFIINSILYHQSGSSWILDHFDASFVQHSEGGPLALTGTIVYDVPSPGSLAVFALLTVGKRRRQCIAAVR